jgi:hypothetical protein
MNTEAIRKLLDVSDLVPHLRPKIAELIMSLCKSHIVILNAEEVYAGTNNGKLDCVRLYKNRTGLSLIESKRDCEQFFQDNKLLFRTCK